MLRIADVMKHKEDTRTEETITKYYSLARVVLQHCPNGYAKSYARAALDIARNDYHAMHVQTLYMLNNMSHWRGVVAKDTRDELRRVSNQLNKF